MGYYKDVREHMQALEKNGLLVRIRREIDKDTELHPLVRLQFRGLPEKQRKAFLFENVVNGSGKKYKMPVTVCTIAASRQIYAIGLQCNPEEIASKLNEALLHPIKPVVVADAAVYEEEHVGGSLLQHKGLDEFPIPISTPGFDIAPFFTSPYWVTKDPETGIANVGTYRAQLKSPTRTGIFFYHPEQHIAVHWNKCRKLGVPLHAAIVVGGSPNIGYVSVAKLPYSVSEFDIAGGIAGSPVELVRCKTVDLEVPANAEVIIEGEISTNQVEPEGPFGEFHGYMGERQNMPFFTVKRIAHRKDAIWQAFLSQFPPSESSKIRQIGSEATTFKLLRHDLNIASVKAVAFHESSGSAGYVVVQMKDPKGEDVMKALEAATHSNLINKISVAVDSDINPWDADAVNWAISYRSDPQRDSKIVLHRASTMDHSIEPTGKSLERDARHEGTPQGSRLLIDATLKWPYPPTSLPKKQHMEKALELWTEEGLPTLELREPWWGYNLGYWSDEDEEQAAAALKGEYYKTGEILEKRRQTIV